MIPRSTIVLAAALGLASPARAGDAARVDPPRDRSERPWTERGAERARELGQRGTDAAKRGASAAGKKVNEGGQAAAAKVVGTQTVAGRIAAVSRDGVTVKGRDGAPVKLRLTGSTKVTVRGQQGDPGALKQGDEVRATYMRSGGSDTATKIEVQRARPRAR